MLKKSLFFFEEFSYITSFTADRYFQHDPFQLFDLSTWGQIHNMADRWFGWFLCLMAYKLFRLFNAKAILPEEQ